MSTPTLPAPGTVPEIPAEPINGVQAWQRPSKPLLPVHPPWEERMRLPDLLPSTHRKVVHLGHNCELLAEILWPNRGPEVTLEQILERARLAASLLSGSRRQDRCLPDMQAHCVDGGAAHLCADLDREAMLPAGHCTRCGEAVPGRGGTPSAPVPHSFMGGASGNAAWCKVCGLPVTEHY